MLTSSHYLLGGFLAVSCAIGALISSPPPLASDLSQERFETAINETVINGTIDISYRGSGRLDDHPEPKTKTYSNFSRGKHVIAHRGSGRVRPSSI